MSVGLEKQEAGSEIKLGTRWERRSFPRFFLGWDDPWRRDRLPTPVFLGFPGDQTVKNAHRELSWVLL